MNSSRNNKWFDYTFGPIMAIISFLFVYWLDPMDYKKDAATAIPAFLLSVVILFIDHGRLVSKESKKSADLYDKIYDAVKNYLHIIRIGSATKAMEYVNSRIPILIEIKNTSFNTNNEIERSDEKFYITEEYDNFQKQIAEYISKNLLCKELGDKFAFERFKKTYNLTERNERYKYKFISHNEPQINFIILEYKNGDKEVLFNWDFRGLGEDPTILLSRDEKIVNMFYIHFNNLWNVASPDYDITNE